MKKSLKRNVHTIAAATLATAGFNAINAEVKANSLPTDIELVPAYAYEKIEELFNKGKLSGFPDGSFQPQKELTRAEFVAMVMRAFDFETQPLAENIILEDIGKMTNWEAEVMTKAVSANLISGTKSYVDDEGFMHYTLSPSKTITRAEMATILTYALDKATFYDDTTKEEAKTLAVKFHKDYDSFASWILNGVYRASSLGLMNGTAEGVFSPNKTATRVEAALVMDRLENYIDNVENSIPDAITLTDKDFYKQLENQFVTKNSIKDNMHLVQEFKSSQILNPNIGLAENDEPSYLSWQDVKNKKDLYVESEFFGFSYEDENGVRKYNNNLVLLFPDEESAYYFEENGIFENGYFYATLAIQHGDSTSDVIALLEQETGFTNIKLYDDYYKLTGLTVDNDLEVATTDGNPFYLYVRPDGRVVKEIPLTVIPE